MEMGIEILNITLGLNGYAGTRDSIIIWNPGTEEAKQPRP